MEARPTHYSKYGKRESQTQECGRQPLIQLRCWGKGCIGAGKHACSAEQKPQAQAGHRACGGKVAGLTWLFAAKQDSQKQGQSAAWQQHRQREQRILQIEARQVIHR